MDVWIVVIKTRQMDDRIGAVYPTREEAEAECTRLEKSQGSLEVYDCSIEHRTMEVR